MSPTPGAAPTPSLDATRASYTHWPFQALFYVLHVGAVYLSGIGFALQTSAFVHDWLLPHLDQPTEASRMEFYGNHLLWWCLIVGGLSGFFTGRFRPKLAKLAWIVPTTVLLYKLLSFHGPVQSVLGASTGQNAFGYYFGTGFVLPAYRGFIAFYDQIGTYEAIRMFEQMIVTGPFYAGIAYSAAALIATRVKLPSLRQLRGLPPDEESSRPEA